MTPSTYSVLLSLLELPLVGMEVGEILYRLSVLVEISLESSVL
jgi:hypothetical protein